MSTSDKTVDNEDYTYTIAFLKNKSHTHTHREREEHDNIVAFFLEGPAEYGRASPYFMPKGTCSLLMYTYVSNGGELRRQRSASASFQDKEVPSCRSAVTKFEHAKTCELHSCLETL